MKNLLNVNGAKALTKNEQKAVKGGDGKSDCESGGGTWNTATNPFNGRRYEWCTCPNHDGNGTTEIMA